MVKFWASKLDYLQADDSDSVAKVTYVIKQGPTDLFSIDPSTGVIKTIKGLDYEKEVQHTLIIGTVENNSDKSGATTKVIVDVQVENRQLEIIEIPLHSCC